MSTVKRKGTFVTSSHYVRTAGCLTSSRSRCRAKILVAYPGTFQSSITRNSLIPGRIEVKLVSMESERSILHVYNQFFVLLSIMINFENRQICLAAYFCAKRNTLN